MIWTYLQATLQAGAMHRSITADWQQGDPQLEWSADLDLRGTCRFAITSRYGHRRRRSAT